MNNKYTYASASNVLFDEKMKEFGWIVFEDALEEEFVNEINMYLEQAYEIRRQIQVDNGIGEQTKGTLHHLVGRNEVSIEFLARGYCDAQIRHFLDGNYILNSLGAVINIKDNHPYVQNIHRDIRSFTGSFKVMIQMMVVLDDFTLDNGATYFLSGSHKQDIKPGEEEFYAHADRAVARKGSLILFDSNLWHAAGNNRTDQPRRALTMAFTRPFFKQQLDYPRLMGYDLAADLSPHMKQILGYNSRIPADLYEYYQPVEKRMYQPGQG
jgi:ectoine hydroxylase-related dioxygenase (phytanoyl-CoA dioxygenase family)